MVILSNKPNKDLRQLIADSEIPQYEIARQCGVSEGTLCRWLRYELAEEDERRQMIMKALKNANLA